MVLTSGSQTLFPAPVLTAAPNLSGVNSKHQLRSNEWETPRGRGTALPMFRVYKIPPEPGI